MKYLATICLSILATSSTHADWLGFRGSHADGVANGTATISCDANSIAWSVDTPGRSVSSPIVVGDQVIVTASSGIDEDRLHVVSYDVASGQKPDTAGRRRAQHSSSYGG